MTIIDVVILSLIEGATEFLPVSSTGHLILTSALLGYGEDPFLKAFNIIIQSGAIMAVLVLYWRRFLPNLPFYSRLAIAFTPAAVIGFLVKDKIDAILGASSVSIVAWALIIGGIVLVLTDSERFRGRSDKADVVDFSFARCLALGVLQCLAFIPGVSRSGATIIGGLWLGMNQKAAAEFSFFLGVPTLLAASGYKILKLIRSSGGEGPDALPPLDGHHWFLLGLGIVLSFVFALIAIRFFMALVQKYGFRHFGYYRIVVGVAILTMVYGGWL
ncbi:MAG: undecaprenyl-diphosphate phosphatase [Bdellovibrionaceae bacterium]|nr:undecaprenyl-diphosphate phosphatase [Pseudobdellovibrionaceae bacterium]